MREPGPGKRVDLLNVVQEFDELERALPYLLHLRCLLDRIEIVAHVMDAAPRRRHDIIETAEIADEQCLGIGALGVEAAIGHRLSAARLVARVYDLMAEALQQLEGRDANFRKEGIDEARDEKRNSHHSLLGS